MINKQELRARATIKKIGGSLMIQIPRAIIEMLELKEGDILNIPFLEFEKVEYEGENFESYEPVGKKEIRAKIRGQEITITQDDVIKILENSVSESPGKLSSQYRGIFVSWNGEVYGAKKVIDALLEYKNVNLDSGVNTAQAINYLVKLGFETGRER
jgi:hypothetical protein